MMDERTGDAIAAGTIVGTFMGWMPKIAALLSAVWFIIQITESQTFKRFCARVAASLKRVAG